MENVELMNVSELHKYAEKLCKTKKRDELFDHAINLYHHFQFSKQKYLAVFILGEIGAESHEAMKFLRTRVSLDEDWRTQEILAKSFDKYCSKVGYGDCMGVIKDWLGDHHANVRRAVIEGLRVWTNKPYFKENPEFAIHLIAQLKDDPSEYVRKSVGNSLSDISKKHGPLVAKEIGSWDTEVPTIRYTYKRAIKHLTSVSPGFAADL